MPFIDAVVTTTCSECLHEPICAKQKELKEVKAPNIYIHEDNGWRPLVQLSCGDYKDKKVAVPTAVCRKTPNGGEYHA